MSHPVFVQARSQKMKKHLSSTEMHLRTTSVAFLLAVSLSAPVFGQNLFSNGTFESDTNGAAPSSWTVVSAEEVGTGASITVSSTRASPFTNVNGTSTKSLLWVDGSEFNGRPYAETSLGNIASGTYTFNADFYVDNNVSFLSASQNFSFHLGYGSNPAFYLQTNENGAFNIQANATNSTLLTLSQSTWYNVQATVNVSARISSGTITSFGGGQSASWSNLGFITSTGTEVMFGVTDYGSSAKSPSVYYDNLSFVSAIPEPSTYAALIGAAVLGIAAWRRRNMGSHSLVSPKN